MKKKLHKKLLKQQENAQGAAEEAAMKGNSNIAFFSFIHFIHRMWLAVKTCTLLQLTCMCQDQDL